MHIGRGGRGRGRGRRGKQADPCHRRGGHARQARGVGRSRPHQASAASGCPHAAESAGGRHRPACLPVPLLPHPGQAEQLIKTFGACRWTYNEGLALRDRAWRETGSPSPAGLSRAGEMPRGHDGCRRFPRPFSSRRSAILTPRSGGSSRGRRSIRRARRRAATVTPQPMSVRASAGWRTRSGRGRG
ncbi:helix-turn-helix domain-containing protein [Streptomyces rubiginosohelvolus]|uniref:helix-turn-helix domain-containing protein n=1 Tax=Streptomyces rubiginosohelvolus TaxID=67362 RepID=UPI0037B7B235